MESEKLNTPSFIQNILAHHLKKVIVGVTLLAVSTAIVYALVFHKQVEQEEDFIIAQDLFDKFSLEHHLPEKQALLKQLEALINQHHDLRAKYEALIGQELLNEGMYAESQTYMKKNWERTMPLLLPSFYSYAEITQKLTQQKYEESIQESVQNLKDIEAQLFSSRNESMGILWAWTSFRLGMLYQITEQTQEELDTWECLLHHLEKEECQHEEHQKLKVDNGIDSLSRVFKDYQFTLYDYLQSRCSLLRNKVSQ